MRYKPKRYTTRWIDESYRGREDELVSAPEIAQMTGADRSTVNGWIRQYDHFPTPVKEVASGPAPSRYFATVDVVRWLVDWRGMDEELIVFADDLDDHIKAVRRALADLERVRDQIRETVETADTDQ